MKHSLFAAAPILFSLLVLSEAQADTYDQYVTLGLQRAGKVVHVGTNTEQTQWATGPSQINPDITYVYWGSGASWPPDSAEEFEVKENCDSGHDYVWLNAYINDAYGLRYEIETTQAYYVDVATNQQFDITSGGSCGTIGQPYAIYNVYDGSPYIIKVWGRIWNDPHTAYHTFFWQHKITPNLQVYNPCWTGSGSSTRKSLRQDEAWWDSIAGWTIGSGNMSGGQPTGTGVAYGRFQTMALGVGFNWTWGSGSSTTACLQSQWTW